MKFQSIAVTYEGKQNSMDTVNIDTSYEGTEDNSVKMANWDAADPLPGASS
jgi:hypothetical protein